MKTFLNSLDKRGLQAYLFVGVRAARFGSSSASETYNEYCQLLKLSCENIYETGLNHIFDTFANKNYYLRYLRECIIAILSEDSSLITYYTKADGHVTKLTPWSLSERILERILERIPSDSIRKSMQDKNNIYYAPENHLPKLSDIVELYISKKERD